MRKSTRTTSPNFLNGKKVDADSPRALPSPLMATGAAVLILLLWNLGGAPLNHDEATYARWTAYPWGEMLDPIIEDNRPPAYFAGLKIWAGIFGLSEWSLRLFSIPFAWLAWWIFAFALRKPFGEPFAWRAAGLLAISPFFLYMSRLAKYFAPLTCLTLAAAWLLWRMLESPQSGARRAPRRIEIAWAAVCLGLLWVHYLGATVWLAMGLWMAWKWIRGRSGQARRLLCILGLSFIGYLPWAVVLIGRLASNTQSDPVTWVDAQIVRRLVAQLGYSAYAFALGHTLEVSRLALAALGMGVAGAAFVFGAVRALRPAARSGDSAQAAVRYCLFFLLISGGLSLAMVLVFTPGLPLLVVSERLGFLLPFAVVLALYGAMQWPRWARSTAAALYALPVALSLFNLYAWRENNLWDVMVPWRQIAHTIAQEGPARAVVFDGHHFGQLGWYYLRGEAGRFYDLKSERENQTLDTLADRLPSDGPVWLVRTARDTSPGQYVSAFEDALRDRRGPPAQTIGYVEDSPGMRRVKEWFRRGTGAETLSAKLLLLRFE